MSRRIDKNEVHRIKDKVTLGVELRTKMESISYNDVRAIPQYANDMLGLWLRGYMTTFDAGSNLDTAVDAMGLSDGFNDGYMVDNAATHGGEFANLMMGLNTGTNAYSAEFLSNYMALISDQNYFNEVLDANKAFYDAQGGMGLGIGAQLTSGTDAMTLMGNLSTMFQGMGQDATTAMQNAQQFVQYAVLRYMFSDTTLTAKELATFKSMFKGISPRKYDNNNSSIFTNKLRIRLNSRVNDNLSFAGRLSMYKVWSDATDVQWMDGTYKSMYMDGNASAVPTDDKIHVERAYFVYKK